MQSTMGASLSTCIRYIICFAKALAFSIVIASSKNKMRF